MTTNGEWLDYLAQNAPDELAAWFDAEHVETKERALDGDTAALNARIAELEKKLRIGWECECRLQAERDELQAKVDELKELNEYHALQYELASEDADRLQAQVDELTAERVKLRSQICKLEDDLVGTSDERDNWKEHSRTIEYRCKKAETDCEIYRKKFGKCLDYADAIHALMDDEGMA